MITKITWRKLKKIGNTNVMDDKIIIGCVLLGVIWLFVIFEEQRRSSIPNVVVDNCYNCKEVQGEVLETEEINEIGKTFVPGYSFTIVKLDTGTITFFGISHYFPKKEIICIEYKTKRILGGSGRHHNVIKSITLGSCSETQKLKE